MKKQIGYAARQLRVRGEIAYLRGAGYSPAQHANKVRLELELVELDKLELQRKSQLITE